MTPAQLHNNLFLFGSVGGALLVETIAWWLHPKLLAGVVFVPLFARCLPLGPRVRAEGDAVVVEARALPWLSLASTAFFGVLLALVARLTA